jgi:Flp pilus assembly protein TadG
MSRSDAPRGQAMVEFALVVSIFVLVLVGLFDVGRAVYAYHTVNNAAREAGRLAIVDQYPDHIRAEAVTSASGLGIEEADVGISFERSDGSACTAVGTPAVSSCVAVVTVPYEFRAATPIIGSIVGVIDMAGESRFPVSVDCATSDCPLGSQP